MKLYHSFVYFGAGDRSRTGTLSPAADFESATSTNFITPAGVGKIIPYRGMKSKRKNKIQENFGCLLTKSCIPWYSKMLLYPMKKEHTSPMLLG